MAVPLAERGLPVTGIELSPAMIDQLRTKADEATIPVIIGDMATAVAPGKYTLVYLVYTQFPTCSPKPSRSRAFAMPPATSPLAAGS